MEDSRQVSTPGGGVWGRSELGNFVAQAMKQEEGSRAEEDVSTEVKERYAGDVTWESAMYNGLASGRFCTLLCL